MTIIIHYMEMNLAYSTQPRDIDSNHL